jgi:hypothetical protein
VERWREGEENMVKAAAEAPLCKNGCGKNVGKNENRHKQNRQNRGPWNLFCGPVCAHQYQKRGEPQGAAGSNLADSFEVKGDDAVLSKRTTERVRTLDDLIRVCEIDTDTWEVERWIANKWEMGSVDKAKQPHTTELYQVKAFLKRKVVLIDARNEIKDLLKQAKQERAGVAHPFPTAEPQATGLMLEVSIPDLHAGKLAWHRETGWENYDTKIAEQVFDLALAALIQRTSQHQFERVLFVVGNDLLNSDNANNTTTKGTPQDTDVRFHKTFAVVRRMVVRAAERLRMIAPVDVVMVPGNHDTLAVWHLGDSLECYFHTYPDVNIDNSPTARKYYQFGKVMLLLTHGDDGRLPDYPLVMATEQPEMFGETLHREAHTGHRHKVQVDEYHGVKVRILPALCAPDAWHSKKTFVGNARAAEAFVWHRDEGLVSTAIYSVPAESRKKKRAA